MRNYEFTDDDQDQMIVLHMMDKAEKYLKHLCYEDTCSIQEVQIQGPEGFPMEMIQFIENTIKRRMQKSYRPKDTLQGVVEIELHDPYTIMFKIASLWYSQKLKEVKENIIVTMGLSEEYVEMKWAQDQFDPLLDDEELS